MKNTISKIINIIFKNFKVQNNKIIFESGRGLVDGNVKAVYDYIVENNITEIKCVWLVNKNTDTTSLRKGDYAYYKTLKSYYHLATAKYWLRSQSIGSLLKKKKEQVYIQLWHGNGVMKKMGYDVNNDKERPIVDHVKEWDYYIANDKYDANVIKSSTSYNKNIDILGMACVDNSIKNSKDKNFKKKVLSKLNIKEKNKKIILYAPTFRDFDLDKDIINVPIEKLKNLKDCLILVRLHPLVREKINKDIFKHKNIINACEYPDCSDILAIADILITDYSSIIYEYSPLNRPIIFYPYDYEKYVELRGGFYVDYKKELPGPLCYTEEELLNVLENIDVNQTKYNKKINSFNKKYNYLSDGQASKRFIDKLTSGYFK